MKSLKKMIKEILEQEEYTDMASMSNDEIAEYMLDQVDSINNRIAIDDFFIKNGITDRNQRKEVLKLLKKKLEGES